MIKDYHQLYIYSHKICFPDLTDAQRSINSNQYYTNLVLKQLPERQPVHHSRYVTVMYEKNMFPELFQAACEKLTNDILRLK
jgi:hypothetical protein